MGRDTHTSTSGHRASTSATCLAVFGDLRGWDIRKTLRFHTENVHGLPLNLDAGFAHVHLGPETVHGPVVYDGTDGTDGRTVVVYTGRRVPAWIHQPELAAFGWEPYEQHLPGGVDPAHAQVDALLLTIDERGHAAGWTRSLWLTQVPRPMQRISIQLGDGHGPTIPVKVLEVGDDLIVDGETTPFAVLSCDHLPPASKLSAQGWVREPWVAAKIDAWKGLDSLAHAVESHAETVLSFGMVTRVTVHLPDGIDNAVLPLLPRDVRTALAHALDERNEDG